MSYWAMHTTHVLVSLIAYMSLLGFTYFARFLPTLNGTDIAAVWIVVGAASAYFIANLKVGAQGIDMTTSTPSNSAQASG